MAASKKHLQKTSFAPMKPPSMSLGVEFSDMLNQNQALELFQVGMGLFAGNGLLETAKQATQKLLKSSSIFCVPVLGISAANYNQPGAL